MPRPRMEPGEWGAITNFKRGDAFYARSYIRDDDGRRRPVESRGTSPEDARRKLLRKLRERIAPTSGRSLTSASKVSDLAAYWLEDKQASVSEQTFNGYRDIWSRICAPALGELLIREVTTGTLDAFFKRTSRTAVSRARAARVVCSGMFSLAVRLDLRTTNPVTDARVVGRKTRPPIRALTPGEFAEARDAIARYCRGASRDGSGHTMGPQPAKVLEDIFTILIATGARIGEVLALRWEDLHLETNPPTLVIDSTLVVPRFKGDTFRRQNFRKGNAPALTVTLPAFAVVSFARRWASFDLPPRATDPVFVTSTGNWVSPSNVRRAWRTALGEDLAWVTPHTMRKTVATAIRAEYGVEGAQVQLGHSNSRVTEAHYIQRTNVAPDMTSALMTFSPVRDESHE